jgi:ankyrin repeat protein
MKKNVKVIFVLMLFSSSIYAGKPSIKEAVKKQDLIKMKEALNAGADPNESWDGNTAIGWIAWRGSCDMLRLLIEKGAKVDGTGSSGNTALGAAVENKETPEDVIKENEKNNVRILKSTSEEKAREKGWLQNADRNSFSTPEEKIKTLLELGANPNFLLGNMSVKVGTPFLNAVDKQNLQRIEIMLISKKVDTELRFDQWAESTLSFVNKMEVGKYEKMDRKDAKAWASVPRYNTPLLFAVEKQNLSLIKLLVENGADINNGKKRITGVKGTYGSPDQTMFSYHSPLDIAVEKGNKEIIEYLKSKGAIKYQK